MEQIKIMENNFHVMSHEELADVEERLAIWSGSSWRSRNCRDIFIGAVDGAFRSMLSVVATIGKEERWMGTHNRKLDY